MKPGEEPVGAVQGIIILLGWLAAACALLALYGNLAAGSVTRFFLYNADALYLPALYRDLISGGRLDGWQLPPAPYFFPDLLLYAPLQAILGDFRLAVLAYGVVQWGLFLLVWAWLVKAAGAGRSPLQTGDFRFTWLAPLFGSAIMLLLASGQYDLFMPAILSAHHFGSLLATLGLLAGLAVWLRRGPPGPLRAKSGWIAAIGGAAALGIFSDALFILQFAVPALLALAVELWAQRRFERRHVLAAGAIFLAIPAGLGLYRLAIPNPVLGAYLGLDAANLSRSLSWLGQWLVAQWPGHAALLLLWAAGMAVGVWRMTSPPTPSPSGEGIGVKGGNSRGVVLAFLLLSPLVTLAGLVLSGNVVERQYLSALMLPAFVIWPVVLADCPERFAVWLRRVGLAAGPLLVLLALPGLLNLGRLGELARLYPPEVACLDNLASLHGWKAGLGDYWQARTFSMFSQPGLPVVQVQNDLSIYHWINNIDGYRREFQFVVIDETPGWNGRLNEQLIRQQFGGPSGTWTCQNSKVLAYDRPQDAQFQQQFLGSPAFARIDNPGDSFTFYAAQLPSRSGDRLGWGRVARSGQAAADLLVDGPQISLPAGSYTLVIHYVNTPQAASENQNAWYVQSVKGLAFADIISGVFPPNAQDVRAEFTLATPGQVALQVYYDGVGTLQVDTIEWSRVK